MNRRFLLLAGSGAAIIAVAAATRRFGAVGPAQAETFEVAKTADEWHATLSAAQFAVLREEDTEPPGTSPLLHEKREGVFHCAGCDLPVYSSKAKYEVRHRLAELLGVAARSRRAQGRQFAVHDANRMPLPPLRRPFRPRLRRRASADRQTALHQRAGLDLQAGHDMRP